MNFLKVLYCRVFQAAFRAALPLLPYREPTVLTSCEALGDVLEKKSLRTVLLVTDSGIVKNGLTAPLCTMLETHGITYAVYDRTQPNPTVQNVEEAVALYRERVCDGIVAIGGGSAMDCAKAVGASVVYPKRRVQQLKGLLRVRRRLPPLIAIPTTAGTGSEVTLAAVITDSDKQHKYALMSFPLIPHYAVLDARLTYSLPPHLTATTGMDALTHAVEAYIGRSTTAQTAALAVEAVQEIVKHLETACKNGQDHTAREAMLRAAYKAGVAFSQSYVGYIHAVAHSLGGRYGTPHGLANAVIMPYVLEMYGASAHKKLHALAVAIGVSTPQDTDKAGAEHFIRTVRALNAATGIPKTLTGIRKEDIPLMAAHAEKEANPLYPVPKLMTRQELEGIYYRIADEV